MKKGWFRLCAGAFAAAVAIGGCGVPAADAGGDWNDALIQWRPYEEGIAAAKKLGKPICLIFYTEWCPHCANYSRVFHDARVVDRAKQFVMIRVDKDRNPELSRRYAPDGEYIPRTFFLSPQGELDPSIRAPRETYRYFYDERDPAPLLAAMEAALGKFR
jgi:thiol-disulfide isomerase/thioredoxin